MARNRKTVPYWKRIRPTGLVFLCGGIIFWVIDQLTDGPFMAGMGPGLAMAGAALLVVSLISWWARSRKPPEAGE